MDISNTHIRQLPAHFARGGSDDRSASCVARPWGRKGLTLVEVCITVAIIGITLAAISVMNSNAIALVRTNKEATAANAIIQERVEQMRTANWRLITSSSHLRDRFLPIESTNAAALGAITEVVTVSAWPDADSVAPIIVRKTPQGVTLVSSGGAVADQAMARIDFDVFWQSGGRERMRSTSTIMSRGGLNRFNLPIPGDNSFPTPVVTEPDDTDNPDFTVDPIDPGASPTPTPTPTPNNGSGNGNSNAGGNGKGNVGGKKGKG